jgi:hypothetical protein
MKLWHGPIGKVVKGHVLDVSVGPFVRALQDYDKQLYVTWNPNKLRGWGCWEIRRRPNTPCAVYQGSHEGMSFYKLMYVESDLTHHVLDAAFLNYDAIRRIKEMDTWGNKNWIDSFEQREEEAREQVRRKANEELKYAIRHNKSLARDLREAARSGIHPAQVVSSIPWALK